MHDYSCNCTTGYEGRNCEIYKACESENCNGGECIPRDSNPLEFVCLCPLGRVGVQCETGGFMLHIIKLCRGGDMFNCGGVGRVRVQCETRGIILNCGGVG